VSADEEVGKGHNPRASSAAVGNKRLSRQERRFPGEAFPPEPTRCEGSVEFLRGSIACRQLSEDDLVDHGGAVIRGVAEGGARPVPPFGTVIGHIEKDICVDERVSHRREAAA
jgi:hypothetical protein